MADNRLDAIVLEGGSSMFYFTGVRWGLSERPFVAVIPAIGELAWICPGFEEARARELVKSPRPTCARGRRTTARTS
jgi:Xaa-Pro dipeptidase